ISGTPFSPEADAVLSWAVREAATNVVRHSRARRCEIEVRRDDRGARDSGLATLEVRDDGPAGGGVGDGAGHGRHGNGLRGLAERVEAVGGTLATGPQAAGGWRLAVSVPLAASTPAPTPAAAAEPLPLEGGR